MCLHHSCGNRGKAQAELRKGAHMGNTLFYKMVCVSDTGKVRDHNEDNFAFFKVCLPIDHQTSGLMMHKGNEDCETAIFDGMGGEAAGELASYTAAQLFLDYIRPEKWNEEEITKLIETLNAAVCEAKERGKYNSIGSTVTSLILQEGMAWIGNLGDSPAYLYRDGQLTLIAELHTDAKMLERLNIKRKPALTQCLGTEPDMFSIVPYVGCFEVMKGDRILLCSDGLTDMMTEEEIASVLASQTRTELAAEELRSGALAAGGNDNITILLCDF